jgi:hypothetical protein
VSTSTPLHPGQLPGDRPTRLAHRRRIRRRLAAGMIVSMVGAGSLLSASGSPAGAQLLGSDGAVCGVTGGLLGGVLSGVGTGLLGCSAPAPATPAPATPAPEPVAEPAPAPPPEVVSPAAQPLAFDAAAPPPAPAPPARPAAATAPEPAPEPAPAAPADSMFVADADVATNSAVVDETHVGQTASSPAPAAPESTKTRLVAVSPPLSNGDDLSSARRAFGVGLLVAGVALVGLGGIGTLRRRQLGHAAVASADHGRSHDPFANTPWAGAGGR